MLQLNVCGECAKEGFTGAEENGGGGDGEGVDEVGAEETLDGEAAVDVGVFEASVGEAGEEGGGGF